MYLESNMYEARRLATAIAQHHTYLRIACGGCRRTEQEISMISPECRRPLISNILASSVPFGRQEPGLVAITTSRSRSMKYR